MFVFGGSKGTLFCWAPFWELSCWDLLLGFVFGGLFCWDLFCWEFFVLLGSWALCFGQGSRLLGFGLHKCPFQMILEKSICLFSSLSSILEALSPSQYPSPS